MVVGELDVRKFQSGTMIYEQILEDCSFDLLKIVYFQPSSALALFLVQFVHSTAAPEAVLRQTV